MNIKNILYIAALANFKFYTKTIHNADRYVFIYF